MRLDGFPKLMISGENDDITKKDSNKEQIK